MANCSTGVGRADRHLPGLRRPPPVGDQAAQPSHERNPSERDTQGGAHDQENHTRRYDEPCEHRLAVPDDADCQFNPVAPGSAHSCRSRQ